VWSYWDGVPLARKKKDEYAEKSKIIDVCFIASAVID
jgi:hypothetical protein